MVDPPVFLGPSLLIPLGFKVAEAVIKTSAELFRAVSGHYLKKHEVSWANSGYGYYPITYPPLMYTQQFTNPYTYGYQTTTRYLF